MKKLIKNGIRCYLVNSKYNAFDPEDLKAMKCNGVAVLDPEAPARIYPQLSILYPWCMNRNIPIMSVDEWIECKNEGVEIEETPDYVSSKRFPEVSDVRLKIQS